MISKKILIISTDCYHTPPEGYGGIERIVAMVYRYYVDLGYTVDIASTKGSAYHTFTHNNLFQINLSKYSFVLCYKYSKEIFQFLESSNIESYIILQNNYSPKLSMLKDLKKCHISVLSEDQQQQYYKNIGILFPVTPNFTDASHFRILSSERDLDIVSIGMIGQHKSPIACLEYAKKYSLSIDFYGPLSFLESESEYEQRFIQLIKEDPQAHLMGEVGDAEKVFLLNKYKYFIFLAGIDKQEWVEPFGIAPLEAQLCGCTVITQYMRGGHLVYVNSDNSIDYLQKPYQQNPEKIRDSVLHLDYREVIKKYYPH